MLGLTRSTQLPGAGVIAVTTVTVGGAPVGTVAGGGRVVGLTIWVLLQQTSLACPGLRQVNWSGQVPPIQAKDLKVKEEER